MSRRARVTVVGVSGSSPLPVEARKAIDRADLALGSAANLRAAGVPDTVSQIELGPLAPALDRLASASAPVVIASGDPGFFGVLRVLRSHGYPCTSIPAASSVSAAYAAAGLPWDDAVVVSAHGRDLAPSVNACRAFGNVAVLTGPGAGAVEIAQGLEGWPRDLVIAQRLGRDDEQIVRLRSDEVAAADPAAFTDPHVVLSLDPQRASLVRADNQPAAAPETGWALPEDAYAHRDSMITKAEVRSYLLARLRPRLGRLVLDIGAGSGSVGIECNRLGAAVACIERDPQAAATITSNALAHEAYVRVVVGSAPDVLDALPAADAAFVGGGGLDALAGVVRLGVPTVVAAFAAIDRAASAYALLRDAGYDVSGVQLAASRLAELPGGSLRLAAENPVLVVTAQRS